MEHAIVIGVCAVAAVAFVVVLLGHASPFPPGSTAGQTWEVSCEWSGYGIASARRADGGSQFVRIDEVHTGGHGEPSVVVRGKQMTYREFRAAFLRTRVEGGTGRYPQYRTYRAKFIGVREEAPSPRVDPLLASTREILNAGGIEALNQFNKST